MILLKKTIAEYFNDTLVQDDSVLENIKEIWKQYVKQTLSQVNIDQALVPSKSKVLMNRLGSAPGMWIEHDGKVIISASWCPLRDAGINNK